MNRRLHLNTSLRNVLNKVLTDLAAGARVMASPSRSLFSKVNYWFTPRFTNLDLKLTLSVSKLTLSVSAFIVSGILPENNFHKHISLYRFQRALLVLCLLVPCTVRSLQGYLCSAALFFRVSGGYDLFRDTAYSQ